MIDREKVLRAMEVHINYSEHDCDECSYDIMDTCHINLMRDALELLKAQEPRVLTFGAMLNGYKNEPLFLEREDEAYCDWAFWCEEPTDGFITLRWYHGNYEAWTVQAAPLSEYGKTWRCWTSRPTDEQRETTPWN